MWLRRISLFSGASVEQKARDFQIWCLLSKVITKSGQEKNSCNRQYKKTCQVAGVNFLQSHTCKSWDVLGGWLNSAGWTSSFPDWMWPFFVWEFTEVRWQGVGMPMLSYLPYKRIFSWAEGWYLSSEICSRLIIRKGGGNSVSYWSGAVTFNLWVMTPLATIYLKKYLHCNS